MGFGGLINAIKLKKILALISGGINSLLKQFGAKLIFVERFLVNFGFVSFHYC